MGKIKKTTIFKNIKITGIASEGKAIAKVNDLVVFVRNVVPGDIVNIRITKKKKNYLEGIPEDFIIKSEYRTEPFCEHFGVCGGCRWQNLIYKEQLKYKQQQVVDNFERIGKINNFKINPITASPKTTYYRNKLEYTFSNNRWLTESEIKSGEKISQKNGLGFHIPKRFDKILDIKNCYLQQDPSNLIRLKIREFVLKNNYSFFNLLNHDGLLRNLIIRTTSLNQLMVILSFYHEDINKQELLLKYIKQNFPEINSLMYVINPKANEIILDLDVKLYSGQEYILEKMEDLFFKIGPKSFFQVNIEQAKNLYAIAKEFAQLSGKEIIYDLYTGIGTIATCFAQQAKKVIGIESIPEAIEDAKSNAQLNNISNTHFYDGDVNDVLTDDFVTNNGMPDIIIIDPPRSGVHEKVLKKILKIKPKKIIYISCNPATQSRDILILNELYKVEKIQPIDMFPHTYHMENIALLKQKK